MGAAEDRAAEIEAAAGGDDRRLLCLCRRELRDVARYQERLWTMIDAAVARQRRCGVPVVKIATWLGVSDSYIARRMFRRGEPRKVHRDV